MCHLLASLLMQTWKISYRQCWRIGTCYKACFVTLTHEMISVAGPGLTQHFRAPSLEGAPMLYYFAKLFRPKNYCTENDLIIGVHWGDVAFLAPPPLHLDPPMRIKQIDTFRMSKYYRENWRMDEWVASTLKCNSEAKLCGFWENGG